MIRTHNKRPLNRRPRQSPRPRRRRTTYSNHNKGSTPRPRFRFKLRWLLLIIILLFGSYHVIRLDIQVRKQFDGRRWELPARVYARPLELYSGVRLTPKALNEELRALGYQKTYQASEPGQYQLRSKNDFIIKTRTFKFWEATDPSRLVQVRFAGNQVTSITELQPNRQIALLRLPPKLIGKIYPTHNEDRVLVPLSEVPKHLKNALIAMEDRSFYDHFGISIRGMLRAIFTNLKGGRMQGASTITQQLVKNFYLTPERTFKRKINEAIMALLLEWHYSKDQILEAYMNEVFLGQDGKRAIHGMGMAARFYFNRPLNELKLPESALLVAVIRGASHYNPRRYEGRALARRNLVLDTMAKQGKISLRQARRAKRTPLNAVKETTESRFPYSAFMELVRRQLHKEYREEDLRFKESEKKTLDLSEGLRVITTLDPFIQNLGEKAMINGLKRLEKRRRRTRNLEGAMVVTRCDNGEVVALINGKKPHYAGFNRPLKAVRQIGSLIKVAVFLAALEKSRTYSLTTMLDDSPYTWRNRYGKVWRPKNYDHRSHGYVPLHRVLARSYNLSTVRLGMKLGLDLIHETLVKMGLKRKIKKMYPSMLLGSISLTPLEVAQMYQTIASGGFHIPLQAIRDVLTHEGKPLQRYSLSVDKRFDAAPIFLLNFAMQEAVRKGTGRRVARKLPTNMVLAGKTGTSNNLRDSWFGGFGSELLTITWVGRDDNKPMGLSGGSGAMVIWGDFIRSVHPQALPPKVPPSIQWRTINGVRIPFIN